MKTRAESSTIIKMTDIRFYHLESKTLEDVLPGLLSKALSAGHRVVVKAPDDKAVDHLNTHLWTYNPNSFLPHGSNKDGFAEDQPIWITTEDENPNNATVLILTDGTESPDIASFKMCCEMLDGQNSEAVKAARGRWKAYGESDHEVTYWQQTPTGWDKKA